MSFNGGNTGAKSGGIPGMVDFQYASQDKEGITRATVGAGTIVTKSDLSELNRDLAKAQEITKDNGMLFEVVIPIISPEGVKGDVQAIQNALQKLASSGAGKVAQKAAELLEKGKQIAEQNGVSEAEGVGIAADERGQRAENLKKGVEGLKVAGLDLSVLPLDIQNAIVTALEQGVPVEPSGDGSIQMGDVKAHYDAVKKTYTISVAHASYSAAENLSRAKEIFISYDAVTGDLKVENKSAEVLGNELDPSTKVTGVRSSEFYSDADGPFFYVDNRTNEIKTLTPMEKRLLEQREQDYKWLNQQGRYGDAMGQWYQDNVLPKADYTALFAKNYGQSFGQNADYDAGAFFVGAYEGGVELGQAGIQAAKNPRQTYLDTAYGINDGVAGLGTLAGQASVQPKQVGTALKNQVGEAVGGAVKDPNQVGYNIGHGTPETLLSIALERGGERGLKQLRELVAKTGKVQKGVEEVGDAGAVVQKMQKKIDQKTGEVV